MSAAPVAPLRRCPEPPPRGASFELPCVSVEANTALYRIHPLQYSAVQYYSKKNTVVDGEVLDLANRFDQLHEELNDEPVLYVSDFEEGAIAERLLRWHDSRGGVPGVLGPGTLRDLRLSCVRPQQALNLIQLHGLGLNRLAELHPLAADILTCDSTEYLKTQFWATRMLLNDPKAQGLVWRSRQDDDRRCMLLLKSRCGDVVQPCLNYKVQELDDESSRGHRLFRDRFEQIKGTYQKGSLRRDDVDNL